MILTDTANVNRSEQNSKPALAYEEVFTTSAEQCAGGDGFLKI